MRKTVKHYLDDLYESINKIEEYILNTSEETFSINTQIQDSILHRIQLIGEIVKRIPEEYKMKYPSIPWKEIAGTRDNIVHDYDGIDLSIVWDIATTYIPKLKPQIEQMLTDTENQLLSE